MSGRAGARPPIPRLPTGTGFAVLLRSRYCRRHATTEPAAAREPWCRPAAATSVGLRAAGGEYGSNDAICLS